MDLLIISAVMRRSPGWASEILLSLRKQGRGEGGEEEGSRGRRWPGARIGVREDAGSSFEVEMCRRAWRL